MFHKLKQNQFSSLGETKKRFEELGIEETYPYFVKWFVRGVFRPNKEQDQIVDNVFWTIRSVLPDSVLKTYSNLPMVYRAFNIGDLTKAEVKKDGFEIGSRQMAWANKELARQYKGFGSSHEVLLGHKPKFNEVVLCLNQATIDFLHVPKEMVSNPGEVILSLDISHVPPEMIVERFDSSFKQFLFDNEMDRT